MNFTPLELDRSSGLVANPLPVSKIDVFIIRAYKIITKETILNGDHIQGSLGGGLQGSNNGNENENGMGGGGVSHGVHPQYSATFNKISKIFNILLGKGVMGEETISKKSAIELFHRFQQIIKELELSFGSSRYAKYFNKINENNLFQIKDSGSKELKDDLVWKELALEIQSVYNARTGKMINQNRKRNSSRSSQKKKEAASVDSSNTNKNRNKENDGIMDMGMNMNMNVNIDSIDLNNGAFPFGTSANNSNMNMMSSIIEDTPTSASTNNSVSNVNTGASINNANANTAQQQQQQQQQPAPMILPSSVHDLSGTVGSGTAHPSSANASVQAGIQDIRDGYSKVISEKDKRIQLLENEINLQRQETQWLRKMLVEDMGCIRNMLKSKVHK